MKKIKIKWMAFWVQDEFDISKKHLSHSDKRSIMYWKLITCVGTGDECIKNILHTVEGQTTEEIVIFDAAEKMFYPMDDGAKARIGDYIIKNELYTITAIAI